MADKKLTVVISQAQGKNPAKRELEESLAAALLMEPDLEVSLVPHLYDLSADHTGSLFLQAIRGDLVMLSWLYPRACHWILDRQGVRGKEGHVLLKEEVDEDEEEAQKQKAPFENPERQKTIPDRHIYSIDLRVSSTPQDYIQEIKRIAGESQVQTFQLSDMLQQSPQPAQLEKYLKPLDIINAEKNNGAAAEETKLEPTKRRWYPVIDYSLCTNCMECIDFCLFGVYGVDQGGQILVEEQDSCKKGCPACSRVCPENAIIFPGHKTPGIAGADGEVAGLKIDLSKLFGAPDALEMAARERDAELVADGRDAVGMSVGIRQNSKVSQATNEELDDLMDSLDALDL
ncbi:ATP-binding protein [Gimesia panareensis]|uniref:4Fe-4S binding domain protein n=1 Tax=Gimesia panareensis TaxID=2527978 RepID=A0A518ABY2_9PLAN|nr:ferredoxin family protein [Gimesia panareensis]QDU52185.1 4Fe-4S binding domain protein [Gimesia panareensis]QDV20087.1 4Fe-4S binding domain protein [Gimesia panareensis]